MAWATPQTTSPKPITIGADVDNGAETARILGSLDDLRCYSRAITDAEVLTVSSE